MSYLTPFKLADPRPDPYWWGKSLRGLGASEWSFAPLDTGPGYRCPPGTTAGMDNYFNTVCRSPSGAVSAPIAQAGPGGTGTPSHNYVAAPVPDVTGTAIPWLPIVIGSALLFGATIFMKKRKK